jgi:hypothetical protein
MIGSHSVEYIIIYVIESQKYAFQIHDRRSSSQLEVDDWYFAHENCKLEIPINLQLLTVHFNVSSPS